jgi:TRAP-type C4-dicarboxylate transport system permease small subunit
VFDTLLRGCAAAAGVILAAIVAGIVINVVLRNAFDTPIHGLLDLVEYGLLLITFLGAPWVLSQGAHVAVDLVTSALPRRIARTVARGTALIGCVVSVILVYYSCEAAFTSFQRGSMIRTAIDVPEWWVLSVMPVTFGLISLEFFRQIVHPRDHASDHSGL